MPTQALNLNTFPSQTINSGENTDLKASVVNQEQNRPLLAVQAQLDILAEQLIKLNSISSPETQAELRTAFSASSVLTDGLSYGQFMRSLTKAGIDFSGSAVRSEKIAPALDSAFGDDPFMYNLDSFVGPGASENPDKFFLKAPYSQQQYVDIPPELRGIVKLVESENGRINEVSVFEKKMKIDARYILNRITCTDLTQVNPELYPWGGEHYQITIDFKNKLPGAPGTSAYFIMERTGKEIAPDMEELSLTRTNEDLKPIGPAILGTIPKITAVD